MKTISLNPIIALLLITGATALYAKDAEILYCTNAIVPTSEITDLSASYGQGAIKFHAKDKDFIYQPPNFTGSQDHTTAMYCLVSEILRANKIDIEYILKGAQNEPNLDKYTKRILVSDMTFIYK